MKPQDEWRISHDDDTPRRRAERISTLALGTNPRALRAMGLDPSSPEAKAHCKAVYEAAKIAAMKRRIGIK